MISVRMICKKLFVLLPQIKHFLPAGGSYGGAYGPNNVLQDDGSVYSTAPGNFFTIFGTPLVILGHIFRFSLNMSN